jgi:rod shape-determining protein MreD
VRAQRLRLAVGLAGALAVQAALAGRIHPWGLVPDVVVLAVATVAGAGGRRTGAAFGFAAGMAVDLYQAGPLGLTALAYTLVGQGLGGPQARPGVWAAARRGAPASTVASVLLLTGGALLGGLPAGPPDAIAGRLLFAAGSGALLAPLVSGALAPLVAPVQRHHRALALRRARALRPAGAFARR